MKKVLIISYYFPPENRIGALRSAEFAKHLPSFGWDPVILTRRPVGPGGVSSSVKTYRTEPTFLEKKIYSFIEKRNNVEKSNTKKEGRSLKSVFYKIIVTIHHFLIEYLVPLSFVQWQWYFKSKRKAKEVIEKEKPDVIFSSSPPNSNHLLASWLSRKYKLPWIPDFRDLWSGNPYEPTHFPCSSFEKILERKTLSHSSYIVTTTPYFSDYLKKIHGESVRVIMNGFNEEEFGKISNIKTTDKFTLTYTGQIYKGRRDPSLIFEALSSLIKEGEVDIKDLEIRFFGPRLYTIKKMADEFNLSSVVNIENKVPHIDSLKKQRETQVLMLLQWMDPREIGICPGKIFEYFGARRPIVAVSLKGGIIEDLISRTGAGEVCSNIKEIKGTLLSFYNEFKEVGKVEFKGKEEEIIKFTRKTSAFSLSKILNKVYEKNTSD